MLETLTWWDAITWLFGLVLTISIVGVAAYCGLFILRRYVGPAEYASLTLLIAVVAGLTALYQSLATSKRTADEPARMLAFATEATKRVMFEVSFPYPNHQPAASLRSISVDLARSKLHLDEATAKSLNDIDTAKLPSALSMVALIQARASVGELADRLEAGVKSKQPVDVEASITDVIDAVASFEAEEKRLYPTRMIGHVALGRVPILQ